jgi:hypothetical protein
MDRTDYMISVKWMVVVALFFITGCGKNPSGDNPAPPAKRVTITNVSPAKGGPGTLVTISGQNFNALAGNNFIRIGSNPMAVATSSTTQLTFTLPSGIASGNYELWVRVGTDSVRAASPFEVIEPGNFVSTDVIPINEAIVNNCFYGVGLQNVHPRLFFSEADVDRIKIQAQTDAFAKSTYDDIISKANAILPTALLDYGLDGANLRIPNIHKFSNEQAPFLVLAYLFTKDTRYANRCWQQLDRMTTWPDWGANRHFLDAGIGAKAAAMAYDGLYHYLSAEQRNKLAGAVRSFVLNPGRSQIQGGPSPFKWWLTDDNWNGICHGGMIMASLATYETDPSFHSQLIATCANGMLKYMESLGPDGASEEGMSYWSYGLTNTFLAFESMKRVLSTTYGLAEQPGFRKTGMFPYMVSGPVGTATFGDDYLYNGKENRFLSHFWFSNYFKDAPMAKAHYDACVSVNANRTVKMNGWMDLLFYPKELVGQGAPQALADHGYIRGIEYAYLQENTPDDNRLYAGIHGGKNDASHGHLDAGTFLLQANGENFAIGNLGVENPYPADFFSTTNPLYTSSATNTAATPGRFYYYRVRTEGKSAMVFNPDARPEQKPNGASSFTAQANDAAGGYYVLDLGDCYSRDVSSYKRGIKLRRTTGLITIQDEFVARGNGPAYWIMHSAATDGIAISGDGKRATMTKNGKQFHATIQAPSDAVFSVVHRNESGINYLSETAPIFNSIMNGKNSINRWYGKLQIKLNSTTPGEAKTIRVDFSKSLQATGATIVPLSGWTTGN